MNNPLKTDQKTVVSVSMTRGGPLEDVVVGHVAGASWSDWDSVQSIPVSESTRRPVIQKRGHWCAYPEAMRESAGKSLTDFISNLEAEGVRVRSPGYYRSPDFNDGTRDLTRVRVGNRVATGAVVPRHGLGCAGKRRRVDCRRNAAPHSRFDRRRLRQAVLSAISLRMIDWTVLRDCDLAMRQKSISLSLKALPVLGA